MLDEATFRLEDYKLKLDYVNAQADRMWTRFNYFVTIQAGLVGLFAIASSGEFKQRAVWASLAEFVIAGTWWLVGARDRFLWRAARRNVERAAGELRVNNKLLVGYKDVGTKAGYVPVGELDPFSLEMQDEADGRYQPWDIRRRLGHLLGGLGDTALGVTMIPMLVPLCATALWWAIFVALLAVRYEDPSFAALGLPLVAGFAWLLASYLAGDHKKPTDPGGDATEDVTGPERGSSPGQSTAGATKETPQRPSWWRALFALMLALTCAGLLIAASTLIGHRPSQERTPWALRGIYAVAVLLAVGAVVWVLTNSRSSYALRVSVALTAAVTLALSAGLTLESDLALRTGPRGKRGPSGHEGRRGPTGEEGQRGPTGHKGRRGARGERGLRGEQGPRGPTGERGPPGTPEGGS